MQVDRRAFLVAATVGTSTFLEACERESYPRPELIHRASSIRLQNSLGSGHAGLLEIGGNYFLYTIQHVADLMREDPTSATAVIPFVSADLPGSIDPTRFLYPSKKPNDLETSAFYPLVQSKDLIREAIKTGEITTLKLIRNKPKIGESVAMPRPDTGRNTIYKAAGFDPSYNVFGMVFTGAGVVCEGRSGGPVLKIEGNRITNKVYGVISVGDTRYRIPDLSTQANKDCSQVIYARPNE